ncbi:MAG: dihydroorotate dehydrogenase electron transfer subunit [Candidatus Methanomethyliaceae archaeon]
MKIKLPKEKLVLPSGIVATTPDIIKTMEDVEGLGVITTKSIGLIERDGFKEPIIAGVLGSLINAVGLPNPGINEFINELKEIYPIKKILMTSIFGSSAEEFYELVLKIEKYTDWIELNLSCPNVKGYGAAIGISPKLVKEIVSLIRKSTDIPIFVKLIPSPGIIGKIAKIAVDAGADGITAVNSLGPLIFFDPITNKPILSNIYGGLSGPAIKEISLMCIREIRENVKVPIIGMGGITTPQDIEEFKKAGADLFGIGTALLGMSTDKIKKFLKNLSMGINEERPKVNLEYKEFRIKEAWGSDTRVLILDGSIEALPGQFVFVWIPGIGEKPFSLAFNNPITLLIKKVGPVSSKIVELKEGDSILLRGPYGNSYIPNEETNLVGGGSGVAPIYFIAKMFKDRVNTVYIGGKTESDLPLYDNLKEIVEVKVATEDGSIGVKGMVTDIIEINNVKEFFNCGPEIMLVKACEIEAKSINENKIFCSIERYTKCGVGICGSCAMDGLRICVDGPVFPYSILKSGKDFGKYKRAPSGRRILI